MANLYSRTSPKQVGIILRFQNFERSCSSYSSDKKNNGNYLRNNSSTKRNTGRQNGAGTLGRGKGNLNASGVSGLVKDVSQLFIPVPVKLESERLDVGAELTGQLKKQDLLKVLNKFFRRSEIKLLSLENGLDSELMSIKCEINSERFELKV